MSSLRNTRSKRRRSHVRSFSWLLSLLPAILSSCCCTCSSRTGSSYLFCEGWIHKILFFRRNEKAAPAPAAAVVTSPSPSTATRKNYQPHTVGTSAAGSNTGRTTKRRRNGSRTRTTSFGGDGQHLIDAGKALQAAAYAQQPAPLTSSTRSRKAPPPPRTAGARLLYDAGDALTDLGHGWKDANWEAVTYAADDCSQHFLALSRLHSHASLQRLYKHAYGELHVVSAMPHPSSIQSISSSSSSSSSSSPTTTTDLHPHWMKLSQCLQEAASILLAEQQFANPTCSCHDPCSFGQSIRDAAQSIQALTKEPEQ